jgi:hypothetical protein
MQTFDDDVEVIGDAACPHCGGDMERITCDICEGEGGWRVCCARCQE